MKDVVFFIAQGLCIGELIEEFETENNFKIKNPALVITRANEFMLAPFLQLVEEDTITVDKKDIAFKSYFTPKRELWNNYSRIFGSGIISADALPL